MAFAGTVPVVYSPAVMYKALQSRHWGAIMGSGVIDKTIFNTVRGGRILGDIVHIPRHIRPDDFQYLDVTSLTAATTPTQVNTGDQKYPVTHAFTQMQSVEADDYRTGENFRPVVINGIADRAAKHMLRMSSLIMNASLSGLTTHNTDLGRAVLSVDGIGEAKAKMGDVSDELTTLLVHPDAYHDLLKELRTDYKDNPVIGTYYLESPVLAAIHGIRRIVNSNVFYTDTTSQESAWVANTAYALTDFVRPTTKNGYEYECTTAGTSHATTEPTWPTTVGATVSDGTVTWTTRAVPDKYASFLLGEKSFNLGFQKETRIAMTQLPDKDNMPWVVRSYVDVVMGFKGTSYTGAGLPNDATVGSAANWAASFGDFRDLVAQRIWHQAKKAGSTFVTT